jgi:hypothetical protein
LALNLSGKPDLRGKIRLAIYNYYREPVYSMEDAFLLDGAGKGRIEIQPPTGGLGVGIFVVEVRYFVGGEFYSSDYYRFSILRFLDNTHPSKNIFGLNANFSRLTRVEDLGKHYMQWGFGSTAYRTDVCVGSETGRKADSGAWRQSGNRTLFFPHRMQPARAPCSIISC